MSRTDKAEHIVDLVAAIIGKTLRLTRSGQIRSMYGDCPLGESLTAIGCPRNKLFPGYQRGIDEGNVCGFNAHRYIDGKLDREWQRFILAADDVVGEPEFDPALREYMVQQLCIT